MEQGKEKDSMIVEGMEVIPVNDIDITDRISGKIKGRTVSVNCESAEVEFEIPNTPLVCEECGSMADLSVHAVTNEVECMATGCGHGHGFQKVIKTVSLSELLPYAVHVERKARAVWEKAVEKKRQLISTEQGLLQSMLDEGGRRGWEESLQR